MAKHLKQKEELWDTIKGSFFKKLALSGTSLGNVLSWSYLPLSLIWLEAMVKLRAFGTPFTEEMLRTALFSLPVGMFCLAICQFWRDKGSKICAGSCLVVLTVVCMIQTVYYTIFQTFGSLYSASGLGEAVAGFSSALLEGVWRALPFLLAESLPLVAFFLLNCRLNFTLSWRKELGLCLSACLVQMAAVTWTLCSDSGAISPRYVYGESFVLDQAVEEFGVITTLRLDARQLSGDYVLFPREQVALPPEEVFQKEETALTGPEREPEKEMEEEDIPTEPIYGLNVLPIDFPALAAAEEDKALQELHAYFSTVAPTAQNQYTGRFAGKNLILITAEAFTSYAVDPELTPTLYKLSNSGFVCRNYYNPLWWVSTYDGEYAICTSMIPKNGVWSLYKASKNALPFCLGNQLQAQGYRTLAYHNHTYNYYNRASSHPHMGYDYKGIGNGLDLPFDGWPRSDLEMMEATVPEYVGGQQPFHVYYLTVSGHLEYNFGGNNMARKNREIVEELTYSEACRAYLATQIELDRAVESLLRQLEEAGELENTVIALAGDHYPYGLTNEEVSELLGHPVDDVFELYKSTLILWSGDMEEPIYIDKPCSSLDILPTLSNLFGLPYDSRLLMGRDILSDAPGLVVLSSRSWITELGRYNTVTDEFTPVEGVELPEDYPEKMMRNVHDMFTYSAQVLEQDYYHAVGLSEGWQAAMLEGENDQVKGDEVLSAESLTGETLPAELNVAQNGTE